MWATEKAGFCFFSFALEPVYDLGERSIYKYQYRQVENRFLKDAFKNKVHMPNDQDGHHEVHQESPDNRDCKEGFR